MFSGAMKCMGMKDFFFNKSNQQYFETSINRSFHAAKLLFGPLAIEPLANVNYVDQCSVIMLVLNLREQEQYWCFSLKKNNV